MDVGVPVDLRQAIRQYDTVRAGGATGLACSEGHLMISVDQSSFPTLGKKLTSFLKERLRGLSQETMFTLDDQVRLHYHYRRRSGFDWATLHNPSYCGVTLSQIVKPRYKKERGTKVEDSSRGEVSLPCSHRFDKKLCIEYILATVIYKIRSSSKLSGQENLMFWLGNYFRLHRFRAGILH